MRAHNGEILTRAALQALMVRAPPPLTNFGVNYRANLLFLERISRGIGSLKHYKADIKAARPLRRLLPLSLSFLSLHRSSTSSSYLIFPPEVSNLWLNTAAARASAAKALAPRTCLKLAAITFRLPTSLEVL